jgi:hypothetical protein
MPGVWRDDGLSRQVVGEWANLLQTLLAMPLRENPVLIPLSEASRSEWAAEYDRLEQAKHNELDDRMRAAMAKLIGMIPRLSLLFQCVSAASREKGASFDQIDQTSMLRAIRLTEWLGRETRRVYGLLNVEYAEADIVARIRANGGHATPRELMRWFGARFRTATSTQSYLDWLVDAFLGHWEWRTGSGRPSKTFVLKDNADNDKSGLGSI